MRNGAGLLSRTNETHLFGLSSRELQRVTEPVTVRAEKIALRSFFKESFPRSVEVTESELLSPSIAMVELQSRNAFAVTTVLAAAATQLD